MTFNLKDFSLHLSYELIKSFGEPYQSSITTVRRFDKEDLRVYVEYERERDAVHMIGEVPIGGLTLLPNDAIAFIEEMNQIGWGLVSTFRIFTTGKSLTIYPVMDFSVPLEGYPDDIRIPEVIELVKRAFSELNDIKRVMMEYGKKEVGYAEISRIWEKAKKTDDPNRKGKLLEELFIQLIQIDGSFILCECNVKTESEEIDIVIQPSTSSPFWSRVSPPLILLECKNWKAKIGSKEVRDFAGKIENRPRLLCRIGFLIATSGFTSGAEKELVGYRARDFVLATITGSQIEELIQSKRKISDLLQRRLFDAGFR